MTKKERELVKDAIRCFSADGDDWDGGMRILFKLLGNRYPMDEILKNVKTIPLWEVGKKATTREARSDQATTGAARSDTNGDNSSQT